MKKRLPSMTKLLQWNTGNFVPEMRRRPVSLVRSMSVENLPLEDTPHFHRKALKAFRRRSRVARVDLYRNFLKAYPKTNEF